MKIALDIEANGLKPTKIWVVVCRNLETGEYHTFRRVTDDVLEKEKLLRLLRSARLVVAHNGLGYDFLALRSLLGWDWSFDNVLDTLIISKLVDYPRSGHSIEDYGQEFSLEKGVFSDWSKYSPEMEEYCRRDVDICCLIYNKYIRYINNPDHIRAIDLEQRFQIICNELTENGFAFNKEKAEKLLERVKAELSVLDKDIAEAFPPRLKLIREVHPEVTKHGTLHRKDFRFVTDSDLSIYNGGPFSRCCWNDFNPSSHRQIIDVLRNAGWKPVDKTKAHIDAERDQSRQRRQHRSVQAIDSAEVEKLNHLSKYGWKVNEINLETLPSNAPKPARLLAKRILLEARRRTLAEWLDILQPDGRIHGKFWGIGAWTHRMAHQQPNTANIPNEFDTQGKKKLLGKELRSLWIAPKGKLLVGCDAEGIQLRIFAHYINDPEFTHALVNGKKADKTDPHSLNQRILGSVCKSRAAAKRFIYALLLGAGLAKLSEILDCRSEETTEALNRLLGRYEGWKHLKEKVFPKDAKRGWFTGLDGRKVRIPGDTEGTRRHLAMSGYLQCGEAVCMKLATLKFYPEFKRLNSKLVNFVHDEWQTETPNDMKIALQVAEIKAAALKAAGEELGLKCSLAGSYWNDDLNDYTIGLNWSVTH